MNTTITLGNGEVIQSRNPTMTSPGLSAHALPKFNINEVARESSADQVRVRNGSITLTLAPAFALAFAFAPTFSPAFSNRLRSRPRPQPHPLPTLIVTLILTRTLTRPTNQLCARAALYM